MAGYDDEENFFNDDDLDALPHDALAELENNAIQFTQAQTQAARLKAPPSSDYGDDFEDEDLDDAVVVDESRSTPAINSYLQRNVSRQASQREQFRPQHNGTIRHPNPNLANRQRQNRPPKLSQPTRFPSHVPVPQNDSMVAQKGSRPSSAPNTEVKRLQRMVEEVMCPWC